MKQVTQLRKDAKDAHDVGEREKKEAQININAANEAITAAAAAQSTADSKEDAFTSTSESFNGLTGAANAAISVTLGQVPKTGFNIDIFFNGLRVKSQTRTNGSKIITFTVPYITETTDDIIVAYSY